MSFTTGALLIGAGFIPSFLWLNFYLRKDCHPEPKRLIILTFALGMLVAPLAVAAQWLFSYAAGLFAPTMNIADSSVFFLWAAFTEEAVKFLAVFYLVMHVPDFDEPVDGMIYLITAALGFAAIENMLVLYKNFPDGISVTLQILALRTVGATLLHALSSALVGYFVALAWFHHHHSRKFLWFGIACATVFHFSFNVLLLHLSAFEGVLSSSVILLLMMALISILFSKIRDRSGSRLLSTQPALSSEHL